MALPGEFARDVASTAAFSVLGLICRIGIELLFERVLALTSSASFVFLALPGNMFGCFVIGLLFGLQSTIKAKHAHLYTGLISGYCGSLTSFSSWNQTLALVTLDAPSTHGGIVGALLGWSFGWWTSMGSVSLGSDLADAIHFFMKRSHASVAVGPALAQTTAQFIAEPTEIQSAPMEPQTPDHIPWLICFWLIGCIVGSSIGLRYDTQLERRVWYLSGLLAPCGAVLRLLLSIRFNATVPVEIAALEHVLGHPHISQPEMASELEMTRSRVVPDLQFDSLWAGVQTKRDSTEPRVIETKTDKASD